MSDVIVIGGGIVGTSAAAFLAASGASVTLFDRTGLASGASGANSGSSSTRSIRPWSRSISRPSSSIER